MAKSKSYMAAYRAAKGIETEPGMRFEPWTRETYPGIWLPYREWDSVRRAINREFSENVAIWNNGYVVVGKYKYTFEVIEYDYYIITDVELLHGRGRERR